MDLLSLPAELIPLIASFLSPDDIARFSLASTLIRALVQRELYRDVNLIWDRASVPRDVPAYCDARERIRAIVASLARDPARCAHLRRFAFWEHTYWLDPPTGELLAQILIQAPLITELQEDDGTPFDPQLTPFTSIAPVWSALRTLPNLRRLETKFGPNVQLNLHELTTLRILRMSMYYVDAPRDGTLPESLQVLNLEYVLAFTNDWFRPSLFAHLQSLALADLTPVTVGTVQRAIETYAATSSSSSLTHVRLDLHNSRIENWNEKLLLRLLGSLASLASSVTHLEILSTPEITRGTAVTTDTRAFEVVEAIANGFPRLQRLVFLLGDTEVVQSHRPVKDEQLQDAELRMLARCRELRYFETNRAYFASVDALPPISIPSLEEIHSAAARALPLHAPRFFALLPAVEYVVFSHAVDVSGPDVWVRKRGGDPVASDVDELPWHP
ncbi:hypothetical protein JCM3770_002517 [Rhodotorula araucariae]